MLNIWKFLKELCWKWENFVTDVLHQKNLFKRCNACGKIMRDVLNDRKICKRCAKYLNIYERVVLKVRKFCIRCAESEKNCSRDVLHVGKSWEMYWMIEKSVRDVLNIRKLMKELCWKWEDFVTDVLNQKKLFKSCTACGKIMRDVLN